MTEFLKAVFGNSAALAVFLVASSLVVLSIISIFVVAFFQGRSVSFWPPSVGTKPIHQDPLPESAAARKEPETQQSVLSISAGTTVITSSGKRVRIESNSYTGTRASLMRARDAVEKQVMMKLFWRGLNPSSSAWAEFSREYKASENLHHRNIVETIDRGLWNGYPFIIYEFFLAGTLHDLIKARDRITGPEILAIAEQVAAGIDYAHAEGRVHRDITPSNILFESDTRGRVAISDFGVARILGALESNITAVQPGFEGTPAYVAPELLSNKPVTPLSDVYGFGVVLFEMIAGQCPFAEVASVYDLFDQKVNRPVPRLISFRKVPADLDQRLFETLAADPKDRPQNARTVLSGIEASLLSL